MEVLEYINKISILQLKESSPLDCDLGSFMSGQKKIRGIKYELLPKREI